MYVGVCVVRNEAEGKKEPSHGAAFGFLLCGITEFAFRKHPWLPSDQKPCTGRRDTVWRLLQGLD